MIDDEIMDDQMMDDQMMIEGEDEVSPAVKGMEQSHSLEKLDSYSLEDMVEECQNLNFTNNRSNKRGDMLRICSTGGFDESVIEGGSSMMFQKEEADAVLLEQGLAQDTSVSREFELQARVLDSDEDDGEEEAQMMHGVQQNVLQQDVLNGDVLSRDVLQERVL